MGWEVSCVVQESHCIVLQSFGLEMQNQQRVFFWTRTVWLVCYKSTLRHNCRGNSEVFIEEVDFMRTAVFAYHLCLVGVPASQYLCLHFSFVFKNQFGKSQVAKAENFAEQKRINVSTDLCFEGFRFAQPLGICLYLASLSMFGLA